MRLLLVLLLASLAAHPPPARADAASAHLLAPGSRIAAGLFNRSLYLDLRLDRAVPFRVFTLDAPMRLIIDFEGLDPQGFDPAALHLPATASALRFGRMRPGWSRLILDLDRPMELDSAELTSTATGATLQVGLRRTSAEAFAASAGAPPGVWAGPARPQAEGAGPLVLLDPGHGGIDPGALRDGVAEKDLVLAFAEDLRAALRATGQFRVLMTREGDDFVSLGDRVALARTAHPDAFLSLHVNATDDPAIAGSIAFTLAPASTQAAAARAERENRADAVAGIASLPPADPVTQVLGELARVEIRARSDALARALAAALDQVRDANPQDPVQSADFQVLHAGATPAVLLELGFLSNQTDRANLQSPDWRAQASRAIVQALTAWASPRSLMRK